MLPEERELRKWDVVFGDPCMSEGGPVGGEKTATGNLKVNFFDLLIRRLAVAGACRQGAHPGIDGPIFQ